MRLFYISLFTVLFIRCASVTSPNGGPKDEIPPKLIISYPEHESLNFKGQEIRLEFDEYIKLKDPTKQILITPRLKETPEILANKKIVTIKFNEELLANTTYSINFRKAVQDITESNPAENLRLAFSTGNIIDTLKISGKVTDLNTQKPVKEATIGLYFKNDTTNLLNAPPAYITFTDENGLYQLENLKNESYKLYALKDDNDNSILDYEDDKYGFISNEIVLTENQQNKNIIIYKNDKRTLELKSARITGKYFIAKYNKRLESARINNDSLAFNIEVEDPTQIKFYNNLQIDSTEVILYAKDSFNTETIDTLYIKFAESQRKYDKYNILLKGDPVIIGNWDYTGTITMNKPSTILNRDSITIRIDSTSQIIPDSIELQRVGKQEFKFKTTFKNYNLDSIDLKTIKLLINKATFLSADNDSSTNNIFNIEFKKAEEFGTIEIKTNTNKTHYTIQLIDGKNTVVEESKNIPEITFRKLKPGTYRLKVLIDDNQNGIWELGDIEKDTQPESIYIYTNENGETEIPLRANFIIGPLILEF